MLGQSKWHTLPVSITYKGEIGMGLLGDDAVYKSLRLLTSETIPWFCAIRPKAGFVSIKALVVASGYDILFDSEGVVRSILTPQGYSYATPSGLLAFVGTSVL